MNIIVSYNRMFPIIPRYHHITHVEEDKIDHLMDVLKDINNYEGRIRKTVILTRFDYTAIELMETLHVNDISVTSVSGKRKPKRIRRATAGFNCNRYQVLIAPRSGLSAETGEIHHYINFDADPVENFNGYLNYDYPYEYPEQIPMFMPFVTPTPAG